MSVGQGVFCTFLFNELAERFGAARKEEPSYEDAK
jgi:hypothetical protein